MSSRGSEFEASEPEVESSGSELDTTSTFSIDSSLAGSSESNSSSISVDSVSASGNGSTVPTFQVLILIMQFALRYILSELHRTFASIMLNLQNNCYVS